MTKPTTPPQSVTPQTPTLQPKGFMFDLDGTLILSDRQLGSYHVIPGAAEVLLELDRRAIPYVALTNGSAYPASHQGPRLRAAGLPIGDEHLYTPNSVAAEIFAKRGLANVLVLGSAGVADALHEHGIRTCFPEDDAARSADAVYVAWHPGCTMEHIHLACERVLAGAALFSASDVPFFATKEGRSFGYSCAINGAIARVTGVEPEVTGKPSALALRFIAGRLGCKIEEIAVVGDDARAEMEMARAGGAIGIGVASGSTSVEEWHAQPPARAPHAIIDSVANLLGSYLLPV